MSPTPAAQEHTAPRGGETSGILVFTRGAANIHLNPEQESDRLFTARFSGRQPRVSVTAGAVLVRYRLGPGAGQGQISLSTAVPWSIHIRGGASHLNADLAHIPLSSIRIEGGASNTTLELPSPKGRVPIHISGGASNVTILRPPATAAGLSVTGGATRLSFDDQQFGALGEDIRMTSKETPARDSFDIRIGSGASRLTIATSGPQQKGKKNASTT